MTNETYNVSICSGTITLKYAIGDTVQLFNGIRGRVLCRYKPKTAAIQVELLLSDGVIWAGPEHYIRKVWRKSNDETKADETI